MLGTLIGLERQWRQRTAGLRTNVLVAVGAAAFSDLGLRLLGADGATRVISYVISGIGFLGAGVILKDGTNIRGLNTAATLWCSAAVGTLSGSRLPAEAATLAGFVLAGNTLLRPLVNWVNRRPIDAAVTEAKYAVHVTCHPRDVSDVRDLLDTELDRICREGTTFRNHVTTTVPCGPARASLLTGLYQMNHRACQNTIPLDTRHDTLPRALRRAGYEPALVGYTTTAPDPRTTGPADPRFTELGDVMDGWRPVGEFGPGHDAYFGWLAHQGYALPPDRDDIWLPEGEDAVPGATHLPARTPAHLSDTTYFTERALEYLKGRNGLPLLPPSRLLPPAPALRRQRALQRHVLARRHGGARAGRQRGGRSRAAPAAALLPRQVAQQGLLPGRRGLRPHPGRGRHPPDARHLFGMMTEVDDQRGRVLDWLDETGQWDDTLVVFTSDHGEQLGDHHLLGKLGYFDQSFRIPLVIRAPGQPGGGIVDAPTESIDLMPTMLDWLGAPVPHTIDGRSLMDFVRGGRPDRWRTELHYEYDFRDIHYSRLEAELGLGMEEASLCVVQDANYKYVHFAALPPLFFDLRADPDQFRNLAADSSHADQGADRAEGGRRTCHGGAAVHRRLYADRRWPQAASLPFLQWLTSPARAAQWGIDTGYVATRLDAWDTPAMKAYAEQFPAAAVARDQLQYAVPELSTHDNQRVTEALNLTLQSALTRPSRTVPWPTRRRRAQIAEGVQVMLRRTLLATAAALAAPAIVRAQTAPALTFYYPIAVGGPLQTVIDFAVLLAAEMHSLQDAGILVSLDEIGGDRLAEWTGGFYPAFMANSYVGGKIWSVPFQRSTMITYYNRQAFEQAKLDPDAFPKTWDELARTARTLTRSEAGRVSRWGIKIAADLGNAQWTFGALTNQVGQRLMNEAGTETYFDAPKSIEALTYWRDLATVAGATPPGISAWPTLSPDTGQANAQGASWLMSMTRHTA